MSKRPLIIIVAPNGARKTKQELGNIPIQPEELALEAKNCTEAGAVMMHLHVRDQEEHHTLDAHCYRDAINAIRREVGQDMIIQATTESVGMYTPEEQMMLVRQLQPESVSIAIREFIPNKANEEEVSLFFSWLELAGIAPQYILYSPEEVAYFNDLCHRKIIPAAKKSVLFVLGKKAANPESPIQALANPQDLDPFLDAWDNESHNETVWAVCAFGNYELDCMLYAIEKGGHVRIGFENNHYMRDGETAESNAALVTQLCNLLPKDVTLVDATTARKMLGVAVIEE